MRVSQDIKVLRGAIRPAVYDLARGLCWPASLDEITLLEHLASGRPISYSRRGSTRLLSAMREKGWIEAGAPARQDLQIYTPPTPAEPEKFENVWFEVTNSCNLTCRHCYANSGPDADRSSEMTTEEWIAVTRKVASYGANKITFIGGEPTLRLDIVDVVSKEVKRLSPNIHLRMFSNLAIARVRKETIDVVKRWSIEFGTALYGVTEQTHDSMTRRPGSWRVTLEAIREYLRNDVDVFVGMYLDLNNQSDIRSYESWIRGLGVSRFEIIAPSRVGRGQSQAWKPSTTMNRLPGVFSFTRRHWDVARSAHNCFFDHVVVKPDGVVSPCIMTRDIKYGDIKNDSLRSIFASEEYKTASASNKDRIPGCKDCEFRYACFDCRPDARGHTQDFLAKPQCGYDPLLALSEQAAVDQ